MSNPIKQPPLPGWEWTNDGARESGVHQRTLIGKLKAIGAEYVYWGNRRANKIEDRLRAIRKQVRRPNPPPRHRSATSNHPEI